MKFKGSENNYTHNMELIYTLIGEGYSIMASAVIIGIERNFKKEISLLKEFLKTSGTDVRGPNSDDSK